MFPFSIPWTQRELQMELPRTARTFPWSQDLELGAEDIDAEHRRLVGRINALLLTLPSRDDLRIAMAYQSLRAAAREHFAEEEHQMQASRFEGLDEHRSEHVELARRLAEMRLPHVGFYGHASPLGMLPFLERWLVPHLRYGDRRFTESCGGGQNSVVSTDAVPR